MNRFIKLLGTTASGFKLGLLGVFLKNAAGNLVVRTTDDTADAELTASKINVSGNDIVLDSDGNALTLSRNNAQSGALQIIYPAAKGTDGQVLRQKSGTAAGVIEYEWASVGDTASSVKINSTSLAFGSTSPLALMDTGAEDEIDRIEVIVDTPFDGEAPVLSIGISGSTSKYMAVTDVDLTTAGIYELAPGLVAQGAESLIATYVADSSAAGAARIQVHYATPA